MKKFQFRLQALLRYREFLEHQAQMAVAKAHHDVMECENEIMRSRNAQEATLANLNQETTQGVSAQRFLLFTNYVRGLEAHIVDENRRRQVLDQKLVKERNVLAQKAIQKKVMENLKERRKEEYYDDLNKKLDKEVDEGIIVRKAREINQ